jgi:predicted DNA-binding transcriptional regulator AlpA
MTPTEQFSLPANEHLMNEREAAAYLGLSVRTLQAYRVAGTGPRHCRIGLRRIAYLRSELLKWINGRTYSSTAAADAAGADRENLRRKSQGA